MDKNEICKKAIEQIDNATTMIRVYFDGESKTRQTVSMPVTDAAKKIAVDTIMDFQNDDSLRKLFYHGEDGVANYLYYLEIREERLVLTRVTDYGMIRHDVDDQPETILYRFDELERVKPHLNEVDLPRKVK